MWTNAIVAKTVTMWNEGQSASEIREQFHRSGLVDVSREAIVAKVHRLRKEGVVLREGGRSNVRHSERHQKARTPPVLPMPLMEDNLAPLVHDIMQLEDHHCRYMHGDARDGKYCGRTVIEGSPWCAIHRTRVWGRDE